MKFTTATNASVLIDSSALIASFSADDALHAKAKPLFVEILLKKTTLMVPDYVIAETLTRVKQKKDAQAAVLVDRVLSTFLTKKTAMLLWTDAHVFHAAQRIFHATPAPRTFSFTDAVIVAHMRRRRIKTLFTFDRDFRRFDVTLAP